MISSYNKALSFVLKWEGGYVDNPEDPGGETKYGISKRSYPNLDIKNLTKQQASKIYKKDYWERIGGDTLPFPFDILTFDFAVNAGVGRASRLVGTAKCGKDYLFKRIEYYTQLKDFNKFGRGWINRTIALYKLIEEMKHGS